MKIKKLLSSILAGMLLLGIGVSLVTAAPADFADCYAEYTAGKMPVFAPTIDGNVTAKEWGEPMIITSPQHAKAEWGNNGYKNPQNSYVNNDQRVKVYLTNDNDYIYLAVTMNHSEAGYGQASFLRAPNISLTLAQWDETTTVPHVTIEEQEYEEFSAFRVGFLNGTLSHRQYANQLDADKVKLADTDRYATYKDGAYTYEVRIPFSATNIDLSKSRDIALSLLVGDSNYFPNADLKSNNRYLMGGTAVDRYEDAKNAGTFVHANNQAMKVSLNPVEVIDTNFYANTAVAPKNGDIKIDGDLVQGEWGEPMIVTSPADALGRWTKGYQTIQTTNINHNQRVKVYATNDNDYIYLAVTLGRSVESEKQASYYRCPHIAVSIAQWADGTNVPHVTVGGAEYEQLSGFRVGFLNGTVAHWNKAFQLDSSAVTLTVDDRMAKYDPDTNTYTYEMRIPFSATNINLKQSNKMALSLKVADSNISSGTTNVAANMNNCYNIGGTGAGNMESATTAGTFPNKDQAMQITLNEFVDYNKGTYVNEAVAVKKGDITLDANVSTEEWGDPVIVTAPGHASQTWTSGFSKTQPSNVNLEQRVKVYATNDNDYIYLAVTMDHSVVSQKQGSFFRAPNISLAIGQWDNNNTMTHVTNGGKEYEQFSGFRVGFIGGTLTHRQYAFGLDAEKVKLSDVDRIAKYDETTQTYTYELRIPFSATNIKLEENRDIALSLLVGDSNISSETTQTNNRYNIGGTGAANMETSAAGVFPTKGQALKLKLNAAVIIDPDTYVRDTVENKKGDITIDANVSTSEWGDPVIITSPYHAVKTWGTSGFSKTQPTNVNSEQRVKVYATNDNDYIYLAVTMDHSVVSQKQASFFRAPNVSIAIGQWDDANTVPVINNLSQFSGFRVGFINNTLTHRQYAFGLDADKVKLTDADRMAKYDEATQTYTYEMRIPITATNIDLTKSQDIALSLLVGDSNISGATNQTNNRYNIGGTGAANMETASTAGAFPVKGNALKLTLQQQYYVKDRVPYISEGVAIDGKISAKEWGYPVIVTNPEHTQNTWGSFATNEPSAVNNDQLACLWLTNDEDYIYVGATLNASEQQGSVNKQATERAHFLFDLAAYNEQTTVPLVDGKEQLAGFVMWLDNDGKPKVECRSTGMEAWTPSADDYKIVYDAATKTYTYEIRIPYAKTNVDLGTSLNMALSASIGTTYTGEGTKANVYHLQTGHIGSGDTSHQGKMIPFTLNRVAFVKDAVSPFSGNIAIDGKVTAEEWGSPVILTFPDHARKAWDFTEKETAPSDQTLKIYITNDAENLYVACTIDHTKLDMYVGPAYNKPHFFFSVGRWNEETGMEHITSLKKEYERFSLYNLNYHNFGHVYLNAVGYSLAQVNKKDCDYVIGYNAEAEMYTYELRIPLSKTTLRFGNGNEVAMSFAVSPGRMNLDIPMPNRYLIGGRGAAFAHEATTEGSFPHNDGKCLKFTLNPNNYTTKPAVKVQAPATGTVNPNTADPIVTIVTLMVVAAFTLVLFSALRRKNNK